MKSIFGNVAVGLLSLGLIVGAQADAAGGKTKEYKHVHSSWTGVFGHFEQKQLQRGYQVYREVCAACHSMELVAFRHLGQKGGPFYLEKCPSDLGIPKSTDCSDPIQNPIVKSHAADFMITDGPDDAGDMFERPGLPSDRLPSPYANRQQATAANGGAYPPDFSLIAKARHHGPDYIYSLLTGYGETPSVLEVAGGQYYNPYYPGDTVSLLKDGFVDDEGHVDKDAILAAGVDPALVSKDGTIYGGAFKMAAPLSDGIVDYEEADIPETVSQYAEDVTAFLMWAAEPKLEERKSMGRFVLLYLFIFAGILYASYRSVWRNAH